MCVVNLALFLSVVVDDHKGGRGGERWRSRRKLGAKRDAGKETGGAERRAFESVSDGRAGLSRIKRIWPFDDEPGVPAYGVVGAEQEQG